jgi:hypothetical protein
MAIIAIAQIPTFTIESVYINRFEFVDMVEASIAQVD